MKIFMIQGTAYWINPNGKIYDIENKHIDFVRSNLELFELTLEDYQSYFTKFKEPFGWEGLGRKEMFIEIFKKGWIRIRENSDTGWTIELWEITKNTAEYILNWSKFQGLNGGKFYSRKVEIHILKLENGSNPKSDKFQLNTTIGTINTGSFFGKFLKKNKKKWTPPKSDKDVCFNCVYMIWAVGIGQGVMCGNINNKPENSHFLRLSNISEHNCEYFESKRNCRNIPLDENE